MDDSIDYAALVNNYLADERMARQLQEEEHAVLAPPPGNFSRIWTFFVIMNLIYLVPRAPIVPIMNNNETITISSGDDSSEDDDDSEDDLLFRNLSNDDDNAYRRNNAAENDPYEESDIPQRRSAVLAPVHVEVVIDYVIRTTIITEQKDGPSQSRQRRD